jgi:lipid II:glycine glycyltransferase (peptidoglycan interpeptide bridge formation enzyme)
MNNRHPLQSPEWAEFRKSWGNRIIQTQYGYLTVHKIPFTKFNVAVFEKGPIPTGPMLDALRKIGKKHNLIFIKLEPNIFWKTPISSLDNRARISLIKLLKKHGCVRGRKLFTPTTFWIDLTRSEDDLLKSFHHKARYNIRYAEKNGVKVKIDNSEEAFENYISLMRETIQRQKFYAHSEKYHRLMWKCLHQKPLADHKQPIAHLLTASYNPHPDKKSPDETLTAWIVFVYDKFLYYPYGASTDKYKHLQSNSLMMWEAIKFGKKMGCVVFDLWGREEGKGFTKFKEGFNPQVMESLGTWDLVLNPIIYWGYRIAESVRWRILRLRNRFLIPKF